MADDQNLADEAKQALQQMFANRVCDPLEWFKHSRSLFAAARVTVERAEILIDPWERSDLQNVAYMLYGFSLENLLKARWILKHFGRTDSTQWTPVAEFPTQLKTHDLLKLARLSHPEIASEYEHELSLLSEAATWSGRYPCSVNGTEGTIVRDPSVVEAAEEIFKRCSREFTSLT